MPSAVIMPSGCSWLQEADPEGHGLWSVTTSRRLPEPGLGATRDRGRPGGPQTRPQCALPEVGRTAARTSSEASRGGEAQTRERGLRVRAHRPGDTAAPRGRLEPAPSEPRPPARPPSPPPLPHHSQGQLEEPREDQVVAGNGPTPTEKHHSGHGGGPAARPRAGQPRAGSHWVPRTLPDPTPN